MKTILQVTIGILLAGLIAFAVRLVVLTYFVNSTVDVMNEQTEKMQAHSQARLAAIKAEQHRREQAVEEAKRREVAAEQRQQAAAAQKAALEREKRKAFDDSYVPPEGCEWPQSEKALIECTNHKMAAKRSFYENYQHTTMILVPDTPESIQFARDQNIQ